MSELEKRYNDNVKFIKELNDKIRILKYNTLEYKIIYSLLFSILPFVVFVLFIYFTKISIDSNVLSIIITFVPFIVGFVSMIVYFRYCNFKNIKNLLVGKCSRVMLYEIIIRYEIEREKYKYYNKIIKSYINSNNCDIDIDSVCDKSDSLIVIDTLDKLSYQYMDKYSNDNIYSYTCILENSLMIGVLAMLVLGITNLTIRDYFLDKNILFFVLFGIFISIIYMLYDIRRCKNGYIAINRVNDSFN